MSRRVLASTVAIALIAVSAAAAQQKAGDAAPTEDEIVIIARKLAMARATFSLQGPYLRTCYIRSSSGDTGFDNRVCIEAKACAEQGFRRDREITDCANRRLVIWERGRIKARELTTSLDRSSEPPPAEVAAAPPEPAILLPGMWEVRREDAAPRTFCLRAGERSATILQLLYDDGREPELNHGACAKWIFSHEGTGFTANRRCFQPNYRLGGEMKGSLGTEDADIVALEDRGTSSTDVKEVQVHWSAKRTGACPR